MAKYKNPFTEGTIPWNIWQDAYLSGKIDALKEFNVSIPSEEEIKEEIEKGLELLIAKDQNKIM